MYPIYVSSFLHRVCHTLLLVCDSSIDYGLLDFLVQLEALNGVDSQPGISRGHSTPQYVMLVNRASLETLACQTDYMLEESCSRGLPATIIQDEIRLKC